MLAYVFGVMILLACIGVIVFTISLNTKSDGLGAAVTGASDSYRCAIGPEEQKRVWLRNCAAVFIVLSLAYTLCETYGVIR